MASYYHLKVQCIRTLDIRYIKCKTLEIVRKEIEACPYRLETALEVRDSSGNLISIRSLF